MSTRAPEHVDVLVVGAGLSGIGAACQLRMRRPGTTFAVLEAREAIGGTWDLFRYPGVRSDSDMYTLSFPFRPWTSKQAIADGDEILDYIRETARDAGIDRRIRYGCTVVAAEWSTPDQRWTSFLRSYPNKVPLSAAVVTAIAERLQGLRVDRLYDNTGGVVAADAGGWVQRSAARYVAWVSGEHDHLTGALD